MAYDYQSTFGENIKGFIAHKQALGFPYGSNQEVLQRFDRFCQEKFPEQATLSKELCMCWAEKGSQESPNGLYVRLVPIRELARYMNRLGIDAYVLPTNLVRLRGRRIVHIFTEEELSLLFSDLDCLAPETNSPLRHIILPVIFRLLYCCGLRPGEARTLTVEQVDLENGLLWIKESKGHKDRIVPIADDVAALCHDYNEQMCAIVPSRKFFFPKTSEKSFARQWLNASLRRVWRDIYPSAKVGKIPCPYDFRHTFATNRLSLWIDEGKDLSAYLPYLSAYLGHTEFSDTAYYIHLVPEFFPQMERLKFSEYANLIPEVGECE